MSSLIRNMVGELMALIRKDRDEYGRMMQDYLDANPVVKEMDEDYTWVILGEDE